MLGTIQKIRLFNSFRKHQHTCNNNKFKKCINIKILIKQCAPDNLLLLKCNTRQASLQSFCVLEVEKCQKLCLSTLYIIYFNQQLLFYFRPSLSHPLYIYYNSTSNFSSFNFKISFKSFTLIVQRAETTKQYILSYKH